MNQPAVRGSVDDGIGQVERTVHMNAPRLPGIGLGNIKGRDRRQVNDMGGSVTGNGLTDRGGVGHVQGLDPAESGMRTTILGGRDNDNVVAANPA